MTFTFFFQNVVNALQWGSFYALIALGYAMVYSILMLFNFAHGDIFMVGSYIGFGVATGLLYLVTSGFIPLPHWLVLVLTIVISMFLTSFVGVIVERIGYRPLRNAPRASAAITGLMIGIILETGNLALLGARRLNFPSLIMSRTYEIGGFAIGSGLAAAGGVLYGIAYPILDPYMGILIGWKAFVAAILGGRGSIMGAALAGFLLGFIEIFVAMIFPSTLRDLIAFSIVLAILTFRPYGFFGKPYSAKLRL